MSGPPWLPADLCMLRQRFPHERTADIARDLGRSYSATAQKALKLGLEKTPAFLRSPASNRITACNLRGSSNRFKPGQQPWNKGLKGWRPPGSGKGHFAPGHKPHTWQPVGTERVTKDGYLQRKVADTGVMTTDWQFLHLMAWEAAHGPVRPGHAVIFRDGDKRHIDAANLECITRAELMRRNSYHTRYPPEVAALVQLKGAINRAVNRRLRAAVTESTST